MKNGIKLIEHFEIILLNELKSKKYELNEDSILRIKNIFYNHLKYYYFNQKPYKNTFSMDILDERNICIQKASFKLSNKVIDIIPYIDNKHLIKIQPIICIDHFESTGLVDIGKMIMHEICHLYSLGDYKCENGIITHDWGINKYTYTVENGKLTKIDEIVFVELNEIVNDIISIYFFNKSYNMNFCSIYSSIPKYSKLIKFVEENINTVVNLYFSAQSDKLRNILHEFL